MAKLVIDVISDFKKPKFLTDIVIFNDIKDYVSSEDTEKYLVACSKYSKKNNVYLVPIRFITNNTMYLCIFNPSGEIEGIQPAIHLNLTNKNIFKTGKDITFFNVKDVKIVLAVGVDIFHPEYSYYASKVGCDVIISSQYINMFEYSDQMMIRGPWNASQIGNLFVVACNNNSTTVTAPCNITEKQDGYMLQSSSTKQQNIKLFTHKLEKTIDISLAKNNIMLEKRYISQLIVG